MWYLKQAVIDGTSAIKQDISQTVSEILTEIEREGYPAVQRFSKRFDDWAPERFTVEERLIEVAVRNLPDELAAAIEFARRQVERFATAQRTTITELEIEVLPGVVVGHTLKPVNSVGSYSPGGRYPLIASSIMTIVPPRVAGVASVTAVAPPANSAGMYGAQLAAMAISGATRVLCLGGVQALAALAFGLPEEDLAPVDMIVGAGNAYVAEAKRQLFGRVGIDLLAGPSEITVIADESADPRVVAADLLGQAEHGFDSPAVLITTDEDFAHQVVAAVQTWLATSWPTKDVAGRAWLDKGQVIVCDDREEVARVSDTIAPEHLELQTRDDDWYVRRLTNYGSLFIGKDATVAYSDKAIGTNHVLPTGRAARYTGGLSVGKFLRQLTYQRLEPGGNAQVNEATAVIARAELMLGHALTAEIRRR
jgi:sulfopropanediol 3-dehydrogenase